ncbi:MAG: PIG-L family deacetylase [Acidobacteriota bacterium]|nr:PIG-L family deacetylase [Acidobacteriota bacterium]
MSLVNGDRARVKAREYTQNMWILHKRFIGGILCALITWCGGVALSAQPIERVSGRTRLGLVLRQLNSTGSFMMITAHPDDENNGVLALLSQGEGVRTTLVTATRGDGGQNEIGPELFDALAALRTEELLAAHRLDGAEQYFTRAVDFGYSFSREETFEQWGREAILGDFVRMIRTIRPDVIAGLRPEGEGGGQHHQASAILAREAYLAAADPNRFPEQLAEGLRPWQASKFYFSAGFPFQGGPARLGRGAPADAGRMTTVDIGRFDPLLGRTFAEIGSEARSMHKCQGMSPLVMLPGSASARYRLAETVIPGHMEAFERSLFDGVNTSIEGLSRFAGPEPPSALVTELVALSRHATVALQATARGAIPEQRAAALAGLGVVRRIRGSLGAFGLTDDGIFEIDFRLAQKEKQFEEAVLLAHELRFNVSADDGVVVPGQAMTVSAQIANHGETAVAVSQVRFHGFANEAVTCGADILVSGGVYQCQSPLRLPEMAKITDVHWQRLPGVARYQFDPDVSFGLPFRPTPFRASFELEFSSVSVVVERPIIRRHGNDLFAGEKQMELQVVPPFAVEVTPSVAIVQLGEELEQDLRVTVQYGGRESVVGVVGLVLPPGWEQTPDSVPVEFTREDEVRTVRFQVKPASGAAVGAYRIGATFESDGSVFERGFQVVEYPHIGRRQLVHDAETVIQVVDVSLRPGLRVGYVEGVGDEVPSAIEQLGAELEWISADQLAFDDLSSFDVIVTGVRAYERNGDLRANNDRLLDYVDTGGTLIVQYNKFEFNEAQYGPYPARVSRDRVTDEHAAVTVLTPNHPLFHYPNAISDAAWTGWVQERGLYFLGDKDSAYSDLIELTDSFPSNPGTKRGALVEARHGQGRWVYVGLGLWRQLPAGTPGAYQLLANLLSLGGD